jgi:hypothetical protein
VDIITNGRMGAQGISRRHVCEVSCFEEVGVRRMDMITGGWEPRGAHEGKDLEGSPAAELHGLEGGDEAGNSE